ISEANNNLVRVKEKLKYTSSNYIRNKEMKIEDIVNDGKRTFDKYIVNKKNELLILQEHYKSGIKSKADSIKNKLVGIENRINYLNPDNVLKRGYSITLKNGRIVRSIAEINENDEIITKISDGNLKSKVIERNNN
ncbi:exodeoxyribonuclease VII large subunit, partial [Bacteroidota bacterium]